MVLNEESPAEQGLVTITHVLVSPDLRQATVWISVLNHPKPEAVIDQLNKQSTHLYSKVSPRLMMKFVPQLTFKLDDKVDEVSQVDALLDTISKTNPNPQDSEDEA